LLLGILTRKVAEEGETIPIAARFKNTGEKEVDAQFKGQITLGDKIIQILESDKFSVQIGEIEKFNFFFTPKKPGKYIISGRVFYSGKKTFESSTSLNVVSKKFQLEFRSIVIGLISLILFLLIATLLYKIRKERKEYVRRMRRLK